MEMPVSPAALPPALPSVFTTSEALAAGVGRERLRRGDLVQIVRGLYRREEVMASESEIVAAYQRQVPGAFAMGTTAARLWGFPLPGVLDIPVVEASRQLRRRQARTAYPVQRSGPDRRIHLGAPDGSHRSTSLVRWSCPRLDAMPLATADDLVRTSRLHTYLQLGTSVGLDSLVAIGDHLVRIPRPRYEGRNRPFATIDELKDAAGHFTGRGAARLREAVELVRRSADSPPETSLRLAFVRAGLPEPLANGRAAHAGSDLGEPDLQWPQWRVIVEYEGPRHRSPEQRQKDAARDERRKLAGWIDLPMVAADLAAGCASAVNRVRAALHSQGWAG
ncbi:MAG: hypothetical protein ACTIN5_12785 [Brachybacterium tyrofermentans]